MLTQVVVWLNAIASTLASVFLAPIQWMPGWLSATIIAVVTGVAMLVVFKYTSNQAAIKKARDQIKANMLAISLFKDDLRVGLACQAGLLGGAMKLFLLSLRPMAVLTIPMVLLLGQLGLWYQARPLRVGEESIVTVQVKDDSIEALNSISMGPLDGSAVVAGPVRVPTKSMVCWNVKPTRDGRHVLEFRVGETSFEKELVAGSGFQATSLRRPAWRASDALVHPRESPFPPDSVVQSIDVTYPDRDSWTSGTNHWVVYWFVIAMIAALVAKPLLKVNL